MNVEEHKKHVAHKAAKYEEVFGSGVGLEVLQDLEDTYVNIELFHTDPLVMASNVAARDVVIRIKNLLRVAQHVQTEERTA